MFRYILALCAGILIPVLTYSQDAGADLGNLAYESLNLPDLSGDKLTGQVVIAVIDNGYRLSHKALKDFYLYNLDEIPGNRLDDDGNGIYVCRQQMVTQVIDVARVPLNQNEAKV